MFGVFLVLFIDKLLYFFCELVVWKKLWNRGWGVLGRDWNFGWNWVVIKKGWVGSLIIFISLLFGEVLLIIYFVFLNKFW